MTLKEWELIDLFANLPQFPRMAGIIERGNHSVSKIIEDYVFEERVFRMWEEKEMVVINGDNIELTELGKKAYQKAIKVPKWKQLLYEFHESFKHLSD